MRHGFYYRHDVPNVKGYLKINFRGDDSLMWAVTVDDYAKAASKFLGRPVEPLEVEFYLDELNEELQHMQWAIEFGITTRTLH